MTYPLNTLCLGILGLRHEVNCCNLWSNLGANLVANFNATSDGRSMLPVHATNHGLAYALCVSDPADIRHVDNPLTPSQPIEQPALWWILPEDSTGKIGWPGGGPEPQTWGEGGKRDLELLTSFSLTGRERPTFVYTPGHYPRQRVIGGKRVPIQSAIASCVDIQCAALYDQRSNYPPSFAFWRLQESDIGSTLFAVLDACEDVPCTAERIGRNFWLSLAMGAKGILIYNGARIATAMCRYIGELFVRAKALERFFLFGNLEIVDVESEILPGFVRPTFSIPPLPKQIERVFRLPNERLTLRVDLDSDRVDINHTVQWRR